MSNRQTQQNLISPFTIRHFEFRVRRRDDVSKIETLKLEAEDLESAVTKLHQSGYLVIWAKSISEAGSGFFGLFGKGKIHFFEGAKVPVTGKLARASRLHILPAVKVRELIAFAIQMSALLHAGVPLIRSLETVQKGVKNNFFRRVLIQCIEDVRAGFALSHALSKFPRVFPTIWGNLIEVGETSGNLPDVLKDIAAYQEATQRVKSKVISAFFYPTMLVILATAAVIFLMLKIIPQFDKMFSGLNLKLPVITQIVVVISHALQNYFLLFAFLVVAGVFGIAFAYRSKRGRFVVDSIKVRMPIMGQLVLEVSIVRFTRGLATMLRAGVPILQALEISGRLVQNSMVQAVVETSRTAVQAGRSLGYELEKNGLFPSFMTQLVSVGEESGELERFLEIIANYYEERIDNFLARLSTLIEPILLVIIGSMIGVIAISMILPIIEISTGMH